MLKDMSHHAYLVTGDIEQGLEAALAFAQRTLGTPDIGNPDVVTLRYGLLSVEDARTFQNAVMRAPIAGDAKVIIVAATRFFHEAQNALLKTFEEPPAGTYVILVLPSEGMVLPTLRSRLIVLPIGEASDQASSIAKEFLASARPVQEKMVAKLLDRTKSDKDDEKAVARAEALAFIEGLTRIAYEKNLKAPSKELVAFLSDLDTFTPMLHDRATPLKIIFEHLLLTLPRGL